MTTKEQVAILMKAKADFYAWKPGDHINLEQRFRCHHQSSRPIVHGEICKVRATKPETFKIDCAGCPRWKYWRKQAKRSIRIAYE